ncbi:MAG: 3'-5' exonuclease [Betaproteobacteria bacterium]
MNMVFASLRHWLGGARRRDVSGSAAGRWVVIDTETSGLDSTRDKLLAIGGVAVDDDGIRVGDSFEIVLRNDAPCAAENIVVHGIGHQAQAQGTPEPATLAAFREWAAGAPRVGFHVDFDREVLRNACHRAGMPPDDDGPWLDLAPLAAALAPEARKRGGGSLDDWLSVFGIECSLRHNAAADALATAELLLLLRAIAAPQGQAVFSALVRTARQQKWLGSST